MFCYIKCCSTKKDKRQIKDLYLLVEIEFFYYNIVLFSSNMVETYNKLKYNTDEANNIGEDKNLLSKALANCLFREIIEDVHSKYNIS